MQIEKNCTHSPLTLTADWLLISGRQIPNVKFYIFCNMASSTPPRKRIVPSRTIQINPDSYMSDRFKLSNFSSLKTREFFEKCLVKLQQNDPTLLSLEIDCHRSQENQSTRFTEALAINSALLDLRIKFHPFTDVIATRLVDAL